MDDELTLTERVALPGDVLLTEPLFELTAAALEYLTGQGARDDG